MKKTYLLFAIFCLFLTNLHAQKVIVLNPEQDYFPIGYDKALYLEDAEHTLTFEQIRQMPDNKFSVPTTEYTSFGVTKSAYWVKFKMANQQKAKFYIRINHPILDTAELYVLKGQDLVMKKEILAKKYEIQVPNSPFLLPYYEQDTLTCYVKMFANAPLTVAMYLVSEDKLSQVVFFQSFIDVLFFGAVLVMLFYNLFIGITTWNRTYFYYVAYSFAVGITVFFLKGYPVVFMGKYHFLINDYFGIIASLGPIFLGFFATNFLQLDSQYHRGKQLLTISTALHLIAILVFVLGFINLNVVLYQIFNVYTNFCILFIGSYLYISKKYKPAKLFLIAFSAYLLLATAVNLTFATLIPLSLWILSLLHIGTAIELVLFSIALGDKINSYRKEALKAQADNLALVKEQNMVLEQKVTERTLALNETNEELNITLQTVEKQRDNIISSINYALRIQNAIIPKEQEIQKYFPESFVLFRPKDIVSGDFYWFADKIVMQEGTEISKKIIVVADCTGHGVSGAFMTMIGNNILNQIVHNQEITQPNEILNQMTPLLEKTLLHSEGKVKDGMDISIVAITPPPAPPLLGGEIGDIEDVKNSPPRRGGAGGGVTIEYAGAMNPLYYIENQEFKEIKADKVPIGGKQKEGFSYQLFQLSVNSNQLSVNSEKKLITDNCSLITIYLCTDGFQDQFGGAEKRKFMVGKFKKLLFEISEKPMLEQKQILETRLEEWKKAGNETQTDDICVLGIRI
jgi:hypothetical protein